MHCLWITRQDPRPADSGELIYSLGLIRALAATGKTDLTILAHEADGTHEPIEGVDWILPCPMPGKSPLTLLSKLPSDAHRLGNRKMREAFLQVIAERKFDSIIIDQAANAWVLDLIPDGIPVHYLSHNHEASVRKEVAASGEGSPLVRLALWQDAEKYARLEKRLCRMAATISGITPRDEARYREEFPHKHYFQLPPGFEGDIPSSDPTTITEQTPRRVVLAGTFLWIAKRRNFEAFLTDAETSFKDAGVEFQVVGKAQPDYFVELSQRFPWAKFEPNVPRMEPYLKDVRIGLIPEALGGGFKLKALDYIFRGIPLASIESALSGLPLSPGENTLVADSTKGLAETIASSIDDLDFLNHAAKDALDQCRDAFHWRERGEELAKALCVNARRDCS